LTARCRGNPCGCPPDIGQGQALPLRNKFWRMYCNIAYLSKRKNSSAWVMLDIFGKSIEITIRMVFEENHLDHELTG
jgi:extradiol dioxygenase family protein